MTNRKYLLAPTRTELIAAAHDSVKKLFRLEKERLETRDDLLDIGCALVTRCGLSLVEAASHIGQTRQRLASELRIRDLMGDQENTTSPAPQEHEQPFLPPASAE